jgi:hypothetical protein
MRNAPGFYCALIMWTFFDPLINQLNSKRVAWTDLGYLLFISDAFEVSEPRDVVYAVLDLLDKTDTQDDIGNTLLKVDYGKLLPDVIRDAVRCALCERKTLTYLEVVETEPTHLRDTQGFFCSWAPPISPRRGGQRTRIFQGS